MLLNSDCKNGCFYYLFKIEKAVIYTFSSGLIILFIFRKKSMENTILSIDCGTQSLRASIFSLKGEILALQKVKMSFTLLKIMLKYMSSFIKKYIKKCTGN
jgi:hypothetical protein